MILVTKYFVQMILKWLRGGSLGGENIIYAASPLWLGVFSLFSGSPWD